MSVAWFKSTRMKPCFLFSVWMTIEICSGLLNNSMKNTLSVITSMDSVQQKKNSNYGIQKCWRNLWWWKFWESHVYILPLPKDFEDLCIHPLLWTTLFLGCLLLTNASTVSYCQYQQEDSIYFLSSPSAECGWKFGQIAESSESWVH